MFYPVRSLLLVALLASRLFPLQEAIAAPAANDTNQIAAHLAAGEFGPALRIASEVPAGPERDRWLGQIAAAQAASGAKEGAASTLFAVGSDATRSAILSRVANAPLSGLPGQGGGAQPDFDSLIELIKGTVAPDSWDDAGGKGAVEAFAGGVMVNAAGELKTRGIAVTANHQLAELRKKALLETSHRSNRNVRAASPLRMVSLTRLERELQIRQSLGERIPPEMNFLAGIYKVKYVLVLPETGDIVLIGPAGDWVRDAEGRQLNLTTGRPVLQLDDFLVLLRNASGEEGRFGCSITPTKENLAKAKTFLEASSAKALKPGQRETWVNELRQQVGKQTIDVYGIDPRSRVAQVIVEADYHMKLIGMGLREGTLGVKSYLDSVEVGPTGTPPPMSVLRWWFTLDHESILATSDRQAFEIRGQGVRVLSQNELLTRQGDRIHTGNSDELNAEFAHSFTKHFSLLAAKYPVYAELENVFDLAIVSAILAAEKSASRIAWPMEHILDDKKCPVRFGTAPKLVDSIVNSRAINARNFIAGVSGGVSVNARKYIQEDRIHVDRYGELKAAHQRGLPTPAVQRRDWWWD